MNRLVVALSSVLTVLFLASMLLQDVTAGGLDDISIARDSHSHDRVKDRTATLVAPWFGPRLGRRKRNPNGEDIYRGPAMERERLEALIEILQDTPLAIIALNEGKRRTAVDFVPRLGRDSGEDLNGLSVSSSGGSPPAASLYGAERYLQDPELAGELMSQRSPPFAPRLGRRVVPFSPRLGRDEMNTS